MENYGSLKQALQSLEGKTFKTGKQGGHSFEVQSTGYKLGKYYLYTKPRTFVKTESEFKAFLGTITIQGEGEPVKQTFVPNESKITLKNHTMENSLVPEVVSAITTTITNAATVSNALMAQFNILSGAPTKEDYEKAEAMSKMANTMNSLSQTQINLINLKNRRS